jgi:hypothetical protein
MAFCMDILREAAAVAMHMVEAEKERCGAKN